LTPHRVLSQAAVGARLGVAQWTVSKIERGLRDAGDAEMLRRCCQAIGCDPRTIKSTPSKGD
jgi:transcriptional regulator with XRE-family HTH domain